MVKPTEEILVDRGEEYGDYEQMCAVVQNIKGTFRRTPNWVKLHHTQMEALEMVATKIGRILTGNHNNLDSWQDIEGYIKKAIEFLPVSEIVHPPNLEQCTVCDMMKTDVFDGVCVDCNH